MPCASVDLRSYAEERPRERHAFVQIVLPLSGHLEIDVSGLQDRLTPSKGAFIHRGVRHTQKAHAFNQSLILDLEEDLVPTETQDRFNQAPFIHLTLSTRKLLHHMNNMIGNGGCDGATVRLWSALLIRSFSDETPDLASRLLTLKKMIEIDPFQPWTVERMAQQAEVSSSHLHLVFRQHFEKTPHLWLAEIKIRKICGLLRHSSLSIAEIAGRAGFSDQTALTRCMKKSLGVTPAAYRRGHFS